MHVWQIKYDFDQNGQFSAFVALRFGARGRLWVENATGVNALLVAVALRGDYEANLS